MIKELTTTFAKLLKDKRVRTETNKYEAFSRQRNTVLSRYRKIYQAFTDLQAGLALAQQFYEDMKETVGSLKQNVESFVENRRAEGGQLLSAIEHAKGSGADREQTRLKDLMERMSLSPTTQSSQSPIPAPPDQGPRGHRPPPLQQQSIYNPVRSPPLSPQFQPGGMQPNTYQSFPNTNGNGNRPQSYHAPYDPNQYGPASPPSHQQFFSPPPPPQNQQYRPPRLQSQPYAQQQSYTQTIPAGWQPPPPPPGPPPSQDYSALQASQFPSGPGGYASDPRRSGQPQSGTADPWAGLSAWK